MTQHTQRFIRTFWALDKSLAAARHFPAVNWLDSYSGYVNDISPWWEANVAKDWGALRSRVIEVLQEESQLQEIVKLVGPDSLPDLQRYVLLVARVIKEAFLQQNAMDPVDAYSTPEKQLALLRVVMHLYERGRVIIQKGAPVGSIQDKVTLWAQLTRAKATVPNDDLSGLDTLQQQLDEQLDDIEKDYNQ